MSKERLDVLLTQTAHIDSREKAKALIMSGAVYVDGIKSDKPGTMVNVQCNIQVIAPSQNYVSRGGLKLEKAINEFHIDLDGKVAMDVGASTGGFTDCMLQNRAKKVVAVDVGYGQLAWSLRTDARVVCLERTNARYLNSEDIGFLVEFISVDVSFISLKKIIPQLIKISTDNAEMVYLIKPQFEAGRENVGKHGVVRDSDVHIQVITDIALFCMQNNLSVLGISYSPIKGPKGNIEYLLYVTKDLANKMTLQQHDLQQIISDVVGQAHK